MTPFPASRFAALDIPAPATRSARYRLLERAPFAVSVLIVALLLVLSFVDPVLGAWYALAAAGIGLVRAGTGAWHLILGYGAVTRSRARSWQSPADVRHVVIVTACTESEEVIRPTIAALAELPDASQMLVVFAREERGGAVLHATAERLERDFGDRFAGFLDCPHPEGLAGEIPGKGANLTWAGPAASALVRRLGWDPSRVLVTSLDCDNIPDPQYFSAAGERWAEHGYRQNLSLQPVALFTLGIWEAPWFARIIAGSNSAWNLICTQRPSRLQNFASHSQPLIALEDMGYWSTQTIVEDGHQYWRSRRHFDADYDVVLVALPIHQTVVNAGAMASTLVAQYKQLARWAYGASDVPYAVESAIAAPSRASWWRTLLLLESHVTLSALPWLLLLAGWVPWLIGGGDGAERRIVRDLPEIIGFMMQVGSLGIVAMAIVTLRLMPPRPIELPRRRWLAHAAQWLLMPIVPLLVNSLCAYRSQLRLFLGNYCERFDVTEKAAQRFHTPLSQAPGARDPGVDTGTITLSGVR